ncbi:hypothetical protein [Phocaeicola massiliensis]|nr:hypothetical protein [Phocaeicola massiliensis]
MANHIVVVTYHLPTRWKLRTIRAIGLMPVYMDTCIPILTWK